MMTASSSSMSSRSIKTRSTISTSTTSLTDTESLKSSRRSRALSRAWKSSGKLRTTPVLSTGRGGSGNIVSAESQAKLLAEDQAVILRKRDITLDHRVVTIESTGRGGTGNILASVAAQSTPFDTSADPDDEYERVVLQAAKNAKRDKLFSTGRGGSGNLSWTNPRRRSIGPDNVSPKKERPRSRSFLVRSDRHDDDEAREMGGRAPSADPSLSRSAPPVMVLRATTTQSVRRPGAGGAGILAPQDTTRGRGREEADRDEWQKVDQRQEYRGARTHAEWRTRTVHPEGEFESFLEF